MVKKCILSDEQRVELTEMSLSVFLRDYSKHFTVQKCYFIDSYVKRPVLKVVGCVNAYWFNLLAKYYNCSYLRLSKDDLEYSFVILSLKELDNYFRIFNYGTSTFTK